MMKFIIPVVITLILGAGGTAAGFFLRPEPVAMPECPAPSEEDGMEHATDHGGEEAEGEGEGEEADAYEYVDFKNQFVVPVIEGGDTTGMIVLSVSVEVEMGTREAVYSREPKLRNGFLDVLFAYSTLGGFSGAYLEGTDLKVIRKDLTEVAKKIAGPIVHEVLIVDIIRQDL